MPNSIDNKIVEMQFDNENFEKNVRQSIKTLEKLNKALELEDAGKGFEQMEKAANSIDLSKLMNAADAIEKRFSAAGIAGAAVINRVVNGLINKVTGLGHTVVNLAKTGGINRALNLEHANFMLNGLIKNADQVAKIINGPVNNAVSGTAYGLDAAANAAAQFVASGVTDMKKLENALTGISGVAAMTSSSYEDISRIFTTVAGQGKVMTMQLRQIEARGLNAAAALGKYLQKTEAEVRDMVTDGKISFEQFAEAMNNAFGDQAKKANETFTGAMSNVRAALSRIGAKIATPSLEALRKVFVSLIKVINQVNTLLSSTLIKRINSIIIKMEAMAVGLLNQKKLMTLLEKVINNLVNGFDLLGSILKPIKAAFRAIFPRNLLNNLIEFNDNLAVLIEKLTLSDEKAAMLQLTFQGLFSIFDIMLTVVKQVLGIFIPGLNSLYDASDSLSTKILNITGFIGFLLTKLDDWLKKNNILKAGVDLLTGGLSKLNIQGGILSKIISGIATVIGGVAYVFYRIGSAVYSFLQRVYELPAVQLIINGIKESIIRLGNMAIPILAMITEGLISLVDSLENFAAGDYLNAGLNKLNDVLNNAYWGFQYLIDTIKGFFGIFNKSKPVADRIEKVAVASEKLYASTENLTGTANGVTRTLVRTEEAISNVGETTDAVANNVSRDMYSLAAAGKLFTIGFGAAIISAGVNIGRAFKNIANVARGISGTTTAIKLFFEQLNLNLRIKTLLAFSLSIVVLAGSLALLTKLDPVRLLVAAGAITILTVAMYKLAGLMSTAKTTDVAKFNLASKGLLEFSAALLILASAARIMSTYVNDWGTFAASIGSLIVTMYALAGAMILIGRYQKNAIKGAGAMIAFGAGVYLIMSSLAKIQTLELDKIADAIPLMLQIISGMVAVSLALSLTITPFGGISFMGIAVGIALLFDALQMASALDPKVLYQVEDLIDEIGVVIQHIIWALAFLQLLSTVEAGLTFLTRKMIGITDMFKGLFLTAEKGIKYLGIASIIVAMAAAIYMIGETVIKLSALTLPEIAQGVIVTGAIAAAVTFLAGKIIEMAAQVFVAEMAGRKIGEGLLGISAALFAFTLSIKILSDMDATLFEQGAAKLAIVGVMLLGFMFACQYIEKAGALASTSMKSATAIAILIGTLVVSLGILSFIPYEELHSAIDALGAVMIGLTAILLALSKLSALSTQATVAVFGIAAVFGVLGGVMWLLKDVATKKVFDNLATLELAVVGMGAIIRGLSSLQGNLTTGLAALGGITAAIGLLTVASMALAELDPANLLLNLTVLLGSVLLLSAIVGALGALGEAGIGLIGVGILVAIAAAMDLFALAAKGFAEASVIFGQGLTIITGCLQSLNQLNLVDISGGLALLGLTILGLSMDVVPLLAFAAALLFATPIFALFGNSVQIFTSGLMALESINLSTIMTTMVQLGQAVQFVTDRFLMFAGFTAIAYAFGTACYYLSGALITTSAGLTAVGIGLTAIGLAINVAIAGFSLLATIIERIGTVIVTVTEKFNTMLGLLKEIGATTISEIYNTLIQFASSQLFTAGQTMVLYLQQGWDEQMAYSAEDMSNGFVDSLIVALGSKDTEIYNAFYSLFENAVEAMYDALGIGAENAGSIAAKEVANGAIHTARAQKPPVGQAFHELGETADYNVREPLGAFCYAQTGLDSGNEVGNGMVYSAGQQEAPVGQAFNNLGNKAGSGLWNGIKNWLSGVGNALHDFYNKLKNGTIFESGYNPTNLVNEYKSQMDKITKKNSGPHIRLNDGTSITWKQYNDARKKGREELNKYIESQNASSDSVSEESEALGANTDATGKSSKAKKENAKANKKKTKEIKEETDALGEESEAVEENTIDYQALAEEIEVVTEKFNEDLNWQGLKTGNKILKSLSKALSNFWSTDFSKNDINQTFESVKGSLKSTADYVAKGTYRFNDSDKLIKKLSTSTMLSSKKIKKEVETTGRTVIKVFEGQMKVFQKNQNGIEKFALAVPKSTKNLAKFAKQALNFSKSLEGINVENIGDSKTLIENLRGIEKYFVKFKDASKSAQGYMKQVFNAFDEAGFKNSMNILGKNIDGVGNVLSKNSKATAYVEDAFISLAATLYDGSEAANEYATEHARLLFLLEHGEATEEEVAEHERAYIKRITDALVEYRNTLVDTLQTQMDIWKEFDKGTIEGGAETLLKNIESQIAGYQNWGNMLMELSKRGVDKDLMKTLTDEGVKSYGKLEAMLQMTREQLALFNQDFKLSQQMIEQTADTALAAMANATTRASQRAAAEKGNKVAQAQLKLSKKTAKQMKEEYEAVAQAVLTTDKVTKKQEKEYLKTLTKQERKEYKKAKKDLKATEAEEKRLANIERARIAEENRLKTVLDSIKTMDDYIKVITEYNNDSAVMTNITNKMSEAFKDMGGVISNISVSTGDANEAFLMFAEFLDATGQDGLNYFEEMSARVKKFTDEIKDSITGVNYLTTAFGTASKIKMADIYDNGLSNIIGNLKTSYQLDQLAKKGYNSYVLQDVINTWKSDKAQGLELITKLIDADASYVEAFNAMTEERLRMSTEISDKMTGAAMSANSKKAIENRVTEARSALTNITNARIAAEQEVGSIQARINAANTRNQEVAERKRLVHLSNLGSKRTKAQTKEMKSLYKKIFGKKWEQGVVFSFTAQDVTPTDTSGMYWELANANAKVNSLRADEAEKTRLLNDELALLSDYNAKLEVARKKLLADANIRVWFENATTSINDFYEALKKVNKGSSEYEYAVGKIADVMKEFTAPIAVFDLEENFKSIKEQAKGIELPAEIKTVEDGLMKFGETLVDVTEDSDQFWTSMKQGLIDYQKELKNTIASSSDFFSMFEPDTDTTANDYLEYADSQIEGLKNWQEYLKKIADMGLNKEIVEKFASQGLSSYTQVSAWANATAEQIGEYNQLWKEYNESVESASNSAMASIAAAWSTAGQALQDSMINMFNNGGAERLKQVGYEASAMVITGVQDGIGGVLPTIISAIEKTSSESAVTTAVGKKIGTAINDGLVQAITSSVTNTVDMAIEKFKMAVDSVNNYANEVLQTEYTITIHVDVSEMDAAIARMNAAISGTNVMANETSQAVTSSRESNIPETDTTVQTPAVTNNVTYNQTINSPTAMNQVEIYRESQAVANQIKSTIALANG